MNASLLARLTLLSLIVMIGTAAIFTPINVVLVAAGIYLGIIGVAFLLTAALGVLD